jgi:hypothetical protein
MEVACCCLLETNHILSDCFSADTIEIHVKILGVVFYFLHFLVANHFFEEHDVFSLFLILSGFNLLIEFKNT